MKTLGKLAMVTGLSGILCLTATASMQAQEGWMRQHASAMIIHRIEQQLQVTDTQRAQIRQILKTEQPTIQDIAQRLQQQNQELVLRQEFEEAYVRTFAQQHASTQEDALVEREKLRSEILQVLTPVQRQALRQLRQSRGAQWMERLSSLGDQI